MSVSFWQLCLYVLVLGSFQSHAQTVTTVRDGRWDAPQTWSGGYVPNAGNASTIIVNHPVTIPSTVEVLHPNVTISSNLTIEENAKFVILSNAGSASLSVNGSLTVAGTLELTHGGIITGTTISNTVFLDGSVFHFRNETIVDLPYATWHPASTILIDALKGNNSVTLASWTQSFGNVVYDCPLQGSFMDFNGRLRHIQGDLIFKNTNRNILRMARGHVLDLTVGGDLIIEGPSEVWFGESGENLRIRVGGSFIFRSTSTASSYLTLSGSVVMEIGGNFELDAVHKLKCTSSSGKYARILIKGDLNLLKGTIDALGTGSATFVFNGHTRQYFNRNASAVIDGFFNYVIETGSMLDLGESLLSNTTAGDVRIKGKLCLGSTHRDGVIQKVALGNVFISGMMVADPGSEIELNGMGDQFIGYFPVTPVPTLIFNAQSVTLLQDLSAGSVIIRTGSFNTSAHGLSVAYDLSIEEGASWQGDGILTLNGDTRQSINASGNRIKDLTIRGGPRTVDLQSRLRLFGHLTILTENTELDSNGNLIVESNSVNGEENGAVLSLSPSQKINGDVLVERFIDAGRIYRYISSPVMDASVQSLKESFPVTGTFSDPSAGPGINSASPSLFYYDEADPSGWIAYPTTGFSFDNPLQPGRGYAAFVRDNVNPVKWLARGSLNVGEIDFKVSFSALEETLGWNLVGNPYAASIAWDATGWQKENVSAGIAVRDNKEGRFRVWNGSVGDLENGLIASGQAFWVKTTGENPVLKLNESAKVAQPATFYRSPAKQYLELRLSTETHYDFAYLQLHQEALPGHDAYDFEKLENDDLDLSILSIDSIKFSISAIKELPCTFHIPLHIRLTAPVAQASLKLNPVGIFQSATYRLVNKRTGLMLDPSNNAFTFEITGIHSEDWILEGRSFLPEPPRLKIPEKFCMDEPVAVAVDSPEFGVAYTLYQGFGEYDIAIMGNAKEWIISNSTPDTSFSVKSETVCGTASSSFLLKPYLPDFPDVTGGYTCNKGSVLLKVRAPQKGIEYHWYHSSTDTSGFFVGQQYLTSELQKSREYFVAAVEETSGCQSNKASVRAEVKHVEKIDVSQHGDSLISSTANGIRWFFDGHLIHSNDSILLPKTPGWYFLESDIEGCFLKDSVYFSFGKMAKRELFVFPNPAKTTVYFSRPDLSDVILTDIICSNGNSVFYLCRLDCGDDLCELDLSLLKSGTYLLLFRIDNKLKTSRISLYK